MIRSANLGFPRIGAKRELKKALETYWKGENDATALAETAAGLRARHWRLQAEAGIDIIPSNDFSLYDQVLDMTAALGAAPSRFADMAHTPLDLYFAMARGAANAPAMEMTKWFDTNYHYIAPEFHKDQSFTGNPVKAVSEYLEAKAIGINTRPVLIGPVTYLSLGKAKDEGLDPLSLLPRLLPAYAAILNRLKEAGADAVQIDEPALCLDLSKSQQRAFMETYDAFKDIDVEIMLATYFEGLRDNLALAAELPVGGLHLDLVRAPEEIHSALDATGDDKILSLGLADGRGVWRTDLSAALAVIEHIKTKRAPETLHIAPSCSLLHVPADLNLEKSLDSDLKSWMAFAKQKLEGISALTAAANGGRSAAANAFAQSDAAHAARQRSARIHNPSVKARAEKLSARDIQRKNNFKTREALQKARFNLPPFPTTTIGSFPQTREVRQARAANRQGRLDQTGYDAFLKQETESAIRRQERLGLDVLVHGEFERNDMVEYFGEQLDGFAFTKNGWVQSYGSRCVKPPVIFGDVSRPKPMTVAWSTYAQSLTDRPVKGMLTGPVTILQWSFVRDDQPRAKTCRQIALAIRDEVADLEKAGIAMIQIDEPAFREGLPLRTADWDDYLQWAVDCFRLSASGAKDETQIHTHMCYSEFNDIMPSIAALDADVISIETSRSDMELLDAFVDFDYPNEIGPGVWDIHSPRVPSLQEMETLLHKAAEVIRPERLWVNPDCGLKTRGWTETEASIKHMIAAAKRLRKAHGSASRA